MQSIRFNVDQDTLFFLINFANALTPETAASSGSSSTPGGIVRPGGGAGELVALVGGGGLAGLIGAVTSLRRETLGQTAETPEWEEE